MTATPQLKRRGLIAVVAAAVAIVGTVAAVLLASAPLATTFGSEGALVLQASYVNTSSKCVVQGEYADVAAGMSVSVYSSGRKVASGSLSPGAYRQGEGCGWRWSIADVPSGGGVYTVHVGAHPGFEVDEDTLREFLYLRPDAVPRA
jgi:hypothetical protein